MKIKSPIVYSLFTLTFLAMLIHGTLVLYDYYHPFSQEFLGEKIKITGTIASLPKSNAQSVRFEFQTDESLVSLYWSKRLSSPPDFKPGQVWSFTVKLKKPRGLSNPGVFDYGEWLRKHGVKATGYIVVNKPYELIEKRTDSFLINQVRYSISTLLGDYINDKNVLAFTRAILLGDKSSLSSEQKKLFQDTGTSHLIAISGLHIGLIFFWFFIVIRLLWSFSIRLCTYVSAQIVGMWGGVLMALGYSLLAGFAISTQRALIMLAVFVIARTLKYNISPRRVLSLSALFVILWWPFSIFDAGFWLSFTAVAFLVYALSARVTKNSFFSRWLYPQFLVIIALMPLTIFWFGTISTSAFIANLVAIPMVSFIIVPSLFIALAFTTVQVNLFIILSPIIKLLFTFLMLLQTTFSTISLNHGFNPAALIFAMLGMLLIFSPKGFRLKIVGLVFLFPAIFYSPKVPDKIDFRMYVLDVGQGLATVIQVKDYVLVYDTGPKYFSGGDAADRVVVPFLRHIGVNKIDTLIISHADSDHRGGFNTLYHNFPVKHVIASYNEINQHIDHKKSEFSRCKEGVEYAINGIKFEFLNPVKISSIKGDRNNLSCVLKISNNYHSVLLTGDIEKIGEYYLIDYHSGQLQADVLLAPHHGSSGSSSKKFISLVQPKYVIYATGYNNRFHFPRSKILKRYNEMGSEQYSTAACGAIEINIAEEIKINTILDDCLLRIK